MIYLTTGANGAGKTLNTLDLVRKKQVDEGRSVYYHGFAMDAQKAAEFGWQEFDPKEWQKLPDGAMLICDECQNQFPVRSASAPLPEYIRALSEHRKHGFDFFMITQHPQNIDMFVRRLIGSPGWHRHLKRAFGTDMVSQLEWSAVEAGCEKSGSGKSARVSMVPFPKHVYSWYASASLHTGKRSIPRQVYVIAMAALLVPLMGYFAFTKLMNPKVPTLPGGLVAGAPGSPASAAKPGPMTVAQLAASYQPRFAGLPHTAPRYDELTKPSTAPYPAACVSMGDRCSCYTQQGTSLDTPKDLCDQIVKRGYFVDWQQVGMQTGSASHVRSDSVSSSDVREPVVVRGGAFKPVPPDAKLGDGHPGVRS